jgi:hypothetical protein
MKLHPKLALGLAVLAMALVPAMAGAVSYQPEYHPEHPTHPPKTHQPKGHAYGYWCKGESKKHVKGEKGTAFSRCVKAVAQQRKEDGATVTGSTVA